MTTRNGPMPKLNPGKLHPPKYPGPGTECG